MKKTVPLFRNIFCVTKYIPRYTLCIIHIVYWIKSYFDTHKGYGRRSRGVTNMLTTGHMSRFPSCLLKGYMDIDLSKTVHFCTFKHHSWHAHPKKGYLSIKAYGLQNQTTYHFNELQDLHGGAWVGGFNRECALLADMRRWFFCVYYQTQQMIISSLKLNHWAKSWHHRRKMAVAQFSLTSQV